MYSFDLAITPIARVNHSSSSDMKTSKKAREFRKILILLTVQKLNGITGHLKLLDRSLLATYTTRSTF